MARRKLNPFTADEAGDAFVPTVKTIKGANVSSKDEPEKPNIKELSKEAKTGRSQTVDSKQVSSPKPEEPRQSVEKKIVPRIEMKPASQIRPSEKAGVQPAKNVSQQQTKPVQPAKAGNHLPAKSEKDVSQKKKESMRDQIIEMVGFQLGDAEFGIDIKKVQDINRMIDITTVPKAPHFVRGVMNLRGKVIPVLSMRSRFGLEEIEADKRSRIIVVEVKGTTIGFIVDAVSEVLRVSSKTIENTTDLVNWIDADYVKGVAKYQERLLVLVDLEKVLFGKVSTG